MSSPISFGITHLTTATSLIRIRNTTFLTDPIFDSSEVTYLYEPTNVTLVKDHNPAIAIDALPPIHHILLSHEDHPDNLDHLGRTLLNGRSVLTTPDGHKNLQPRPGVQAMKPWKSIIVDGPGGDKWKITGTPCIHTPPGECTGFVLEAADGSFGTDPDNGLPRAFWFSGDTILFPELVEGLKKRFKIVCGLVNLGGAKAPAPDGTEFKITMDGKDAEMLVNAIGMEKLVPIHFTGWKHFRQEMGEMKEQLEGLGERVVWVVPGVETVVECRGEERGYDSAENDDME
ncbi:Metallo-hydrolase/oxidoreductase [Ascobolus immersus RN42]|uniref:Metallo-hydrolase/oxidoreductase n=1 Tax=Ascobolus immersus RN42 TaxID=1160509 RepID=A0A3N4I6P4_ASCIM|nr:Metallo-hydrolase/oxidoreductase [Ascobolus immersus RN42]